MFGVNWNPHSRLEWFTIMNTLGTKAKRCVWVFFAAQCWAIWTTYNKFTIEGKFSNQPANCIFKTLLNLQLWRPLLKLADRPLMDELEAMTKNLFYTVFTPPPTPPNVS
jgi:hypothetical protein